jgi:hypothetical protein
METVPPPPPPHLAIINKYPHNGALIIIDSTIQEKNHLADNPTSSQITAGIKVNLIFLLPAISIAVMEIVSFPE